MDVESRTRRLDILIGCGHDLQRPELGPRPKEHLSRICFPRILRSSPRLLLTTSPILVPDIMTNPSNHSVQMHKLQFEKLHKEDGEHIGYHVRYVDGSNPLPFVTAKLYPRGLLIYHGSLKNGRDSPEYVPIADVRYRNGTKERGSITVQSPVFVVGEKFIPFKEWLLQVSGEM